MSTQAAHVRQEPTGWVGWAIFAAVMMSIIGVFQAIAGLVALFNDEYYLVGKEGLLVEVDYTAWGWTHLILGAVIFFGAFAVFNGRVWGRAVGILLAGMSMVVNIGFLAAYPVWSTIIIAIDVLVIYALAVHGGELQEV